LNILAYLSQGEIFFALEKERKKNKVLAVSPLQKDVSFAEDKILATFSFSDMTIPPLIEEAKKLIEDFNQLEETLSLEELYLLVQEEEHGFLLEELTSFMFSSPSSLQKLALFSALLKDKIFFKQKNNQFFSKSQEEVDLTLKKIALEKEREEQKKQEKNIALNWLQAHLNKESLPQVLPPPKEVLSFLKPVKTLAIEGDESLKKSVALEILHHLNEISGLKIEGNPVYASFKLLRDLGVFHEDENLLIQRYALTLYPQEEEKEEVLNLIQNFKKQEGFQENLTHLTTFSVDDAKTKDIDDAFSVENLPTGYRFFIHIAHASLYIPPKSLLDNRAFKKTTSLYLPNNVFSMLPLEFSENLCSLLEQKEKNALSFIIETNKNFEILNTAIKPSVVFIKKNKSYEEVNEILANPTHNSYWFFKTFYNFALIQQKKRLQEQHGIEFAFPTIIPKIVEGQIVLKHYNPFSQSAFIVKEMMVLGNALAANFCKTHSLPIIYTAQDEPDAVFTLENRLITEKAEMLSIVKYMKKAYTTTQPHPHYALGLSCYTQATSPIRRYQDLVIQRQITAFITNKPLPYSIDAIYEIKTALEIQKPIISQIESESNKYWLLKYLLLHYRNKPLEGIVTKELPDGYLVEIQKTLTYAKIISKQNLELGQKIEVKLHTIIPRIGIALGNY